MDDDSDTLDCTLLHHRTHSLKKIVGISKEGDMAIYEMILMVVAAVNCLDIDPREQDLTEVSSNIDSGVTTLNL